MRLDDHTRAILLSAFKAHQAQHERRRHIAGCVLFATTCIASALVFLWGLL